MTRPAAAALAAFALAVLPAPACVSAEDAFTRGRLEDLCVESIPACGLRAGCVLEADRFLSRSFPGGERVIVRADEAGQRLVVRLLLDRMSWPGTELRLQALGPSCARVDEARLVGVDVFDAAGDDGVLQLDLELAEPGDHVLEIFSDMSAAYLLTVDLEG